MTPHEIATIRSTWSLMEATTDTVASRFYDRLFTVAPDTRALFAHSDMSAQQEKLAHTLALVVRSLDDLAPLHAAINALGARHGGYGVTAKHYELVGGALLDTFAEILGPAFTTDARNAWGNAYGILAGAMQQAADRRAVVVQ